MKTCEESKCSYPMCGHGGTIEPKNQGDICVGKNGKQYHPDCYRDVQRIKKIKKIWKEYVDPDLNVHDFVRKIQKWVLDGYTPRYMLFVIHYAIKQNMQLKSLAQLGHYIRDTKIQNKYNLAILKDVNFYVDRSKCSDPKFSIKAQNQSGFEKILND